jgi:site-specific DNA recombinase
MYQRAQKGLWNGGNSPYGYKAENKRLVPNSDEAPRVQFMFQHFANAPSLSRLRDELHRRGWYTRSGKRWGKTALDQILRNPTYCGQVRFNEQRFKGEHQPLVEESLFKKVQAARPDRSHSKTKINRTFLLKGLLRCSECGSWMTPHYTQKRAKDGTIYRIPYYRCTRTMHFDNAVCTVKHVNADQVEQIVIAKLSELGQDADYLRTSVEELNRDLKHKVEPLEREAAQIKVRLQEIEQEITRYVKALGQGKLSIVRLEKEIAALQADKDVLQSRYNDLQREINSCAVGDYNVDILQRTLKDFRNCLCSANSPRTIRSPPMCPEKGDHNSQIG